MDRIDFTRAELRRFSPSMKAFYADTLLANKDMLARYGVLASGKRFAHFMGQFGAETAGGVYLREDLNYSSVANIRNAWKARAAKASEATLKGLVHNPKALAEWAYNGRMGNREGTTDGYDFRGGGWLQTTGRDNVEKLCASIGVSIRPDILDDPVVTLQFACKQWQGFGCNELADADDLLGISRAINLGSVKSSKTPNGLDHRRAWFAAAHAIWWSAAPEIAPEAPTEAAEGPPIAAEASEPPAAPDAPEPTVEASAASLLGNVGTLNQLADEGSRLAGNIRLFLRWWWTLLCGGTAVTTTVATTSPNRGSAGLLSNLIATHPLLAVGVTFLLAMAVVYAILWVCRHYLLTAARAGRYRPQA